MILHTVNKKPSSSTALASCFRLSAAGSGILLIEDGVYAAFNSSSNKALFTDEKLSKYTVYVLEEDLVARGLLGKIIKGIKVVSYLDFVELCVRYTKVQSWS